MTSAGASLAVEALLSGTDIRVRHSYPAARYPSLSALGKRLLDDLVSSCILQPGARTKAHVDFYRCEVESSSPADHFSNDGHFGGCQLGAALKRLDDGELDSPLVIAELQSLSFAETGSISPLVAHVAIRNDAPGKLITITLFSQHAQAQHIQMVVHDGTTVGDVRQHIRTVCGVPFSRQRWLSLQRKCVSRRSSLESADSRTATAQYNTLYEMMLDDTRTLESYGVDSDEVEIHASVELTPATQDVLPPPVQQQDNVGSQVVCLPAASFQLPLVCCDADTDVQPAAAAVIVPAVADRVIASTASCAVELCSAALCYPETGVLSADHIVTCGSTTGGWHTRICTPCDSQPATLEASAAVAMVTGWRARA